MNSMKQRMLAGELYLASDPELRADAARAQKLLHEFNSGRHDHTPERHALLGELLGEVGADVGIRPPFYCDYGTQISIGPGTFVNFGCVLLDVMTITIGAHCQLGPAVQLLTATHPVDPEARGAGWEYGRPIVLEDNVWLGGGVIVCPGVSIGADTVVGAGSVVVSDLPPRIVAAGSPASVVREITEGDRVEIPREV